MFDFLSSRFSSIFSTITGKSHLTDKNMAESLEKVKEALLQADVPQQVVDTFIADIKKEAIGQKVLSSLKPGEQLIKVVHERLKVFLGGDVAENSEFKTPATVMVMGLQGSGKTTSIAKIAHLIQEQAQQKNKKQTIMMASVDFYRPAAVDQLAILAHQVGAIFYRSSQTDPVKAAHDSKQQAQQQQIDLLLLDTAGRLHIDGPMLQELKDIDRAVQPDYKLLVLDAMTGQESLNVAQAFNRAVGYHMAMLTKIDSDTRAGAAFAFRYVVKKPIVFIGIGEKTADIEYFYPDRMAGRILGMGDMLSFIEKAELSVKQSEQAAMEKAFMQGRLTLQDFANQLAMVNKLGSLSQISKYMPGIPGFNISPEMIEKGERELKKFRAIIGSMTNKERTRPAVLDGSRKKRIAMGAGVMVTDVNLMLARFEESQQYVKLFKQLLRK